LVASQWPPGQHVRSDTDTQQLNQRATWLKSLRTDHWQSHNAVRRHASHLTAAQLAYALLHVGTLHRHTSGAVFYRSQPCHQGITAHWSGTAPGSRTTGAACVLGSFLARAAYVQPLLPSCRGSPWRPNVHPPLARTAAQTRCTLLRPLHLVCAPLHSCFLYLHSRFLYLPNTHLRPPERCSRGAWHTATTGVHSLSPRLASSSPRMLFLVAACPSVGTPSSTSGLISGVGVSGGPEKCSLPHMAVPDTPSAMHSRQCPTHSPL
jgi:hypothetical protein